MKKRVVNIIGAGKLGTALGRIVSMSGSYEVGEICNRSIETSQIAVKTIGAGSACRAFAEMSTAGLWMLAVDDMSIAPAAVSLAGSGKVRPGDVVFHCSGAMSSSVLDPIREVGAHTGSLHPARSFADPLLAADSFAGTFCAVEGGGEAERELISLVHELGGVPFVVESAAKAVYHAALVFASNYLVVCLDSARSLLASAHVPDEIATRLMCSLAEGTLVNVREMGPVRALTGPIARADVDTIKIHLDKLRSAHSQSFELYVSLARAAIEIARNAGTDPIRLSRVADELCVGTKRGA